MKDWNKRVSFDEALGIIAQHYSLPSDSCGIRVDFKATADKGLPTERIVVGHAVLRKIEHELIIESIQFVG